MAEPTLGDVHFSAGLTDFSLAYWQNPAKYVARNVFPATPVAKQTDKYHIFDKAALLRTEAGLRAPNTKAPVRTFTMSTGSYYADVWSIAVAVSEQHRANADFDLEQAAARLTAQDQMIRMDVQFASAAFSTGIWATESTATWNTSTGDPIGDIQTGILTILQNTGYRPNTLVLGAQSWYGALWSSTAVLDRLPDNAPRITTPQFIANLFDLDRVYIAESVRNTATEDSTGDPTMAFNLSDHALLAYVDPSPSQQVPTAGRTFIWSGLVGSVDGLRTKRMDIPDEDKMPLVETDAAYDFKVTATDLGYLIKDTVS